MSAQTSGATPLFVACQKGFHLVVNLLLDRGAAVNQALVRVALGCWAPGPFRVAIVAGCRRRLLSQRRPVTCSQSQFVASNH